MPDSLRCVCEISSCIGQRYSGISPYFVFNRNFFYVFAYSTYQEWPNVTSLTNHKWHSYKIQIYDAKTKAIICIDLFILPDRDCLHNTHNGAIYPYTQHYCDTLIPDSHCDHRAGHWFFDVTPWRNSMFLKIECTWFCLTFYQIASAKMAQRSIRSYGVIRPQWVKGGTFKTWTYYHRHSRPLRAVFVRPIIQLGWAWLL